MKKGAAIIFILLILTAFALGFLFYKFGAVFFGNSLDIKSSCNFSKNPFGSCELNYPEGSVKITSDILGSRIKIS